MGRLAAAGAVGTLRGWSVVRLLALTGTAAPFPRLVQATVAYAAEHPDVDLWVQYGHYRGPPPECGAAFIPRADVLARLSSVDAVVCHAGSGTIRDVLLAGHIPVLMPRRATLGEHVDDHQLDIARAMAAEGRAIVAEADTLAEAIAGARARRGTAHVDTSQGLSRAVADEAEDRVACAPGRRRIMWPVLATLTRLIPIRRVAAD